MPRWHWKTPWTLASERTLHDSVAVREICQAGCCVASTWKLPIAGRDSWDATHIVEPFDNGRDLLAGAAAAGK